MAVDRWQHWVGARHTGSAVHSLPGAPSPPPTRRSPTHRVADDTAVTTQRRPCHRARTAIDQVVTGFSFAAAAVVAVRWIVISRLVFLFYFLCPSFSRRVSRSYSRTRTPRLRGIAISRVSSSRVKTTTTTTKKKIPWLITVRRFARRKRETNGPLRDNRSTRDVSFVRFSVNPVSFPCRLFFYFFFFVPLFLLLYISRYALREYRRRSGGGGRPRRTKRRVRLTPPSRAQRTKKGDLVFVAATAAFSNSARRNVVRRRTVRRHGRKRWLGVQVAHPEVRIHQEDIVL